MKLIFRLFYSWIPLAIVITGLSAIIYLTGQNIYRLSANDPQIQIASDLSSELSNGANPQIFMPKTKTDITKSLATYVIIYDESGKLLVSSATVGGEEPDVPKGIFADTKIKEERRFTWETSTGDRSAVVIKYFHGKANGFILAGRSIKEVEIRKQILLHIVLIGYLVTLAASFAGVYISKLLLKSRD